MKKRFSKHLVACWVVASIIFAIIIQILFSYEVDCELLHAKWSAGDILTYVSTVALGLLAVWQNQKLNEENDKSQERLEQLSIRANELSVISKIIERENQNLLQLKKARDDFLAACAYRQRALGKTTVDTSYNRISFKRDGPPLSEIKDSTVYAKHNLTMAYISLCGALKTESRIYTETGYPLQQECDDLHEEVTKYLNGLLQKPFQPNRDVEKKIVEDSNNFLEKSENYISEQEQKLLSVIYDHLTLDEIKALYVPSQK